MLFLFVIIKIIIIVKNTVNVPKRYVVFLIIIQKHIFGLRRCFPKMIGQI